MLPKGPGTNLFLGAYFGSSISLFTHLIQFAILLMGVFEIRVVL